MLFKRCVGGNILQCAWLVGQQLEVTLLLVQRLWSQKCVFLLSDFDCTDLNSLSLERCFHIPEEDVFVLI